MDRVRRLARTLRHNTTDAERHLWRFLRGRQVEGFRFRRQVPVAGYVADFVCPQAMLIVELDGGQHAERVEYDANRTTVLQGLGYRVLRYWNQDVLLRTDDVLADIHRGLTKSFTPPRPSPSLREREGEERTDDVLADIHCGLTKSFTPPRPSPSLREREGEERTDDVLADIHRGLTRSFTPPRPSPSLREREGEEHEPS